MVRWVGPIAIALRALAIALILLIAVAVPVIALAAGAVAPAPPDVNRSGEVLATLNDWRSILYAALYLTAAMLTVFSGLFVFMLTIISRAASASGRLADGLVAVTTTMTRLEATLARVEAERAPRP